ncbi:MAG: ABC transporter permease [Candidatus Electryonea clarkiae]|nr:ABC transporter permease [Candidatus Electryonea clarkiae]MDP8288902.1 ABC transporter permease [Candidatus Electryonea clarkiae]
MRLAHAIRGDILFQFRHGFYYAYIFVTVIYILALLNLHGKARDIVTTVLLFTDTTMLGYFFIGSIVLLEKGQNILASLFVTPLRLYEYFIAKITSLTLIAILSSLIIVIVTHGITRELFIFLPGLVLISCFFTLFGFIFSAKAKNVNDYFARALGVGLFISLPIIGFLNLYHTPIFYIFPTHAALILIDILFKEYSSFDIIYAFICLTAWSGIAAYIAYKMFYKHVILTVGTGG